MELCSSSSSSLLRISTPDLSFSSSLSHFQLNPLNRRSIITRVQLNTPLPTKPKSKSLNLHASLTSTNLPKDSPQRLLKELSQRNKTPPKPKLPPKRFILRPPLDDKKLAERFLNSPQLSLNSFPLLSSCLPSSKLNASDKTWMQEYLLEVKQALGYSLEASEENPARSFDTLVYLAFQHPSCERAKARHVKNGHSRLWFLGQYVLELALCEFFLVRYPRESPGPMRERVFGLIGKRFLAKWVNKAGLQNLVFPFDDIDKLIRSEREPPVK